MWAIAFDTFDSLDSAQKSGMFPFPVIFVLGDTWIYVSTSDSGDIATNIKVSVNEAFCFTSALNIPNIDPNDGHI